MIRKQTPDGVVEVPYIDKGAEDGKVTWAVDVNDNGEVVGEYAKLDLPVIDLDDLISTKSVENERQSLIDQGVIGLDDVTVTFEKVEYPYDWERAGDFKIA